LDAYPHAARRALESGIAVLVAEDSGLNMGHGETSSPTSPPGRLTVACLEREDYATIGELDARYADLELGLADCALVVIASRYKTDRILSFDERHFRAVTPLQGGAFTILPSDS
jgi:hypothetical protein